MEFKLWVIGVVIHWIFSILLWGLGVLINPTNHFSLLETWAIVMMFIVINFGIQTYKDEEIPSH
jgi:hypothetical protein